MIKLKDKELTNIWTELLTKANEKMTNKKVRVMKHGQMVLYMKENIKEGKNMALVDFIGPIILNMRDFLSLIK